MTSPYQERPLLSCPPVVPRSDSLDTSPIGRAIAAAMAARRVIASLRRPVDRLLMAPVELQWRWGRRASALRDIRGLSRRARIERAVLHWLLGWPDTEDEAASAVDAPLEFSASGSGTASRSSPAASSEPSDQQLSHLAKAVADLPPATWRAPFPDPGSWTNRQIPQPHGETHSRSSTGSHPNLPDENAEPNASRGEA